MQPSLSGPARPRQTCVKRGGRSPSSSGLRRSSREPLGRSCVGGLCGSLASPFKSLWRVCPLATLSQRSGSPPGAVQFRDQEDQSDKSIPKSLPSFPSLASLQRFVSPHQTTIQSGVPWVTTNVPTWKDWQLIRLWLLDWRELSVLLAPWDGLSKWHVPPG